MQTEEEVPQEQMAEQPDKQELERNEKGAEDNKEDFQKVLREEIFTLQEAKKEQEKEIEPPPSYQFQIMHPPSHNHLI